MQILFIKRSFIACEDMYALKMLPNKLKKRQRQVLLDACN